MKRKSFSDQIRQAIGDCGKTRYRIAQETGIDQAVLSKFVLGQRAGISMATLDLLAECIGLRVVLDPKSKGGR